MSVCTAPSSSSLAPCFFISHGGPGGLLHPDGELHIKTIWKERIAPALSNVKGMIWFSAHWYTWRNDQSLGYSSNGRIIYDFGEFFDGIFDIKHKSKAFSTDQVQLISTVDGLRLQEDSRGLDHGVWIPLHVMQLSHVPVLQVQLPSEDPTQLMQLGRSIRHLREQGYAVITSGGSVHNLRHSFGLLGQNDGAIIGKYDHTKLQTSAWANDFAAHLYTSMQTALATSNAEDASAMANVMWQTLMTRKELVKKAHPTIEHLAPIFVAMGAATGADITKVVDGFSIGDLGMHTYRFA